MAQSSRAAASCSAQLADSFPVVASVVEHHFAALCDVTYISPARIPTVHLVAVVLFLSPPQHVEHQVVFKELLRKVLLQEAVNKGLKMQLTGDFLGLISHAVLNLLSRYSQTRRNQEVPCGAISQ